MTAKHRNKNNIIDKNSHSSPDDVARKPSEGHEVRGPRNWTRVSAVLCYVILVLAVGSAALYLQRVLGEMGRLIHRTEEAAQKYADLTLRLDSVYQQVESLSSVAEAFDPTVLDPSGGAAGRGPGPQERRGGVSAGRGRSGGGA
ncbi:hypothetical protein GJAV_G00271580 [Gymnothorax javanicus]|nr:hypothetical protein GJAV_G00271580 [Gymnothorax javanicus]